MNIGFVAIELVTLTRDTLVSSSGSNWLITVLAALIAAVVSLLVSWRTLRATERHRIDAQIDHLVELGIKYPLMEDDSFCKNWTRDNRSEDAMRYDNYCCFVFNLLESLWRFNYNSEARIQNMFDAREMIKRHKKWWLDYDDNRSSYPEGFQNYVDRVLKEKE